ncbi:protein phosphatase 2A subunit A3, partial [Striga asiatica]
NLGLSPFINLNNDDVNEVLLLSHDSIFKQPQDLEKIIGTPNTTISSEIFDHRADDQVPVMTLKRKRGRPKTIPGNTSTSTGVDLRDQVPPTNQKKKPGRPKKILASTSTQS